MLIQQKTISLPITITLLILATQSVAEGPLLQPFPNTTVPLTEGVVPATDSLSQQCPTESDIRSIEGTCNNLLNPSWGSIETPLRRAIHNGYADLLSTPKSESLPNPRTVSNIVFSQGTVSVPNSKNASDMIWQFGQFLDHDLDLSDAASPREELDISIPTGDEELDPEQTGTKTLKMSRSKYHEDIAGVRQQENELTSWIDGSQIYGSTKHRSMVLRKNDGTGQLLSHSTSGDGDLLPFNNCEDAVAGSLTRITECLPNEKGDKKASDVFVAGDVRVNEQAGLIAMHTLFMREHNYQASRCHSDMEDIQARDDEIFECARKIVIAELQKITFYDFLPILLGTATPGQYTGYDSTINPSITNEFATASYRFGHSALSPRILRLNSYGGEISEGHLSLRDAFFCVDCITMQGGIDPILMGLSNQVHQAVDALVVDDVRNFLFGMPGEGGEDLVARNIQRGRDHGLPSYTSVRLEYGLSAVNSFEDIPTDAVTREKLRTAYNNDIHAVEFWPGALAERPVNNGLMGELNSHVIKTQLIALRDGDRLWFENSGVLTDMQLATVRNTTLTTIIRRNTVIGTELADNAFIVGKQENEVSSALVPTVKAFPYAVLAVITGAVLR